MLSTNKVKDLYEILLNYIQLLLNFPHFIDFHSKNNKFFSCVLLKLCEFLFTKGRKIINCKLFMNFKAVDYNF